MYHKSTSALLVFLCLLLSCKSDSTTSPADGLAQEIRFNLPKDFVLEDLYSPSTHEQGSWVALAPAPNNTLYAADQFGKLYRLDIPAVGETLPPSKVNPLDLEIGEAHGLLWAFDALYVAVNKDWKNAEKEGKTYGSGIYKVTDTNEDSLLDKVDLLLKLEGSGEHGPHSFVLAPDGKEIYFIAGNHVLVPDALAKNSRLPGHWAEDNLFEPFLDARGHANDIKAPGGWIAKFDPSGTEWELISAGYRNPFDMAFNADGELFAYDADMEWDIGMPWYRPTRICHVTSGSEYGWRTGSGKWPAYYPDNLPAVHNLEQGSPTAVLSAAALKFPDKYKDGLFIMDWSFGTMYHIDIQPKGSSYMAQREEFLSGVPLPLTDMVAGPDGHLYFATGGRGLESHLYRLRYDGPLNTSKEMATTPTTDGLRKLRHELETYHNSQKATEGIALAWENLAHDDRFIRYAARIILEHQPVNNWLPKYKEETDATKQIMASIALARLGEENHKGLLYDKLASITLENLAENEQIDLLRAYALGFMRLGMPQQAGQKTTIINHLNKHFPHTNNEVNKELAQLLLYLEAPGITEKLVAQLEHHTQEKTITEGVSMLAEEATLRSEQYGPLIREVIAKMPPSEAIYYGMLLSNTTHGWTPELRERYFQWYYDVLDSKGGMSFKAYMENVRQRALAHVPEKEREYYQELSGSYSPATAVADLPAPIGPGNNYNANELGGIVWGESDTPPDFQRGERAFKAGMCILCHRMRGEGGASGPDLTQAHTKFGRYDLMFSIYSPNDDISDQYANTLFELADGKKVAGRIKSENETDVVIMPNPFNEQYTVSLATKEITSRGQSPISPMPTGLLNRLNAQEIRDLFQYIQAGGDEKHELYTTDNHQTK
jgi:putative heme-binding domain-containing protein